MARNNSNTAIEKSAANQVQLCEQPTVPQQEVQQNRLTFTPAVDIWDTGQEWVLVADIPGANPEGINITCEESTLTLEAQVPSRWPEGGRLHGREYEVGNYRRTFRIGEDIEVNNISAEFNNGVLMLHMPKTPRAQARKIPIKAT